MTILDIDPTGYPGPRYRAIAEAIAAEVQGGRLAPGSRLPTHRDLAWRLNVTVGTVTRAYAELARRGIVSGEIGRGTFVQGPRAAAGRVSDTGVLAGPELGRAEADLIDLSLNYPAPGAEVVGLADMLRALADDPTTPRLLQYHRHAGLPEHRAAGAEWIARGGYHADPHRLLITAGAQHALLAALSATARPGDRVGAEQFTHTGLMVAAELLGVQIEGIAMDGEGLLPEAVEQACRGGVRAVNLVSTLQNPTTAVMGEARRRAIAEVARRYDVPLIEDDIFAFLAPDAPPPVAAFAPEHVLYLTSLSKTVAPGLRVGYLVMPERFLVRGTVAIRGTSWMAPPITAEIATRWVRDGTAARVLESHRTEAAARMAIARDVLAGHDFDGAPGALHVWLRLPPPWRAQDFAARAREAGVLVATQVPFVAGRLGMADPPGGQQAARICLGGCSERAALEPALRRLVAILEAGPPQASAAAELSSIL